MDYEKLYKQAVEKARKLCTYPTTNFKSDLEDIFPELKESEEKKVKRILHSISSKMSFHLHDIFTEEEFQCFDAWSHAWLEKQGEQKPTIEMKSAEESLGIDSATYNKIVDEVIYGEQKDFAPQVDGFDAELNALLKKYEHLSKEELQEPLEFYLGVVRDDLDIVREEKPKWTDEDECYMGECISAIATKDSWSFEEKRKTKHWLKSLKQRMEEQ